MDSGAEAICNLNRIPLEDNMKRGTAGKALVATLLIGLLGLGVTAFADSRYPVSGQDGRGWQNSGSAPRGYGNATPRGMTTPGSPNTPDYRYPRGGMNQGNMPMMGTPRPGYGRGQMNGGRMMGPYGGGRNCSW